MDEYSGLTVSVERLPYEIREQILLSCPDISTLRSLILTCSGFHVPFTKSKLQITTTVLSNEIHPSVQNEAAVAVAATKLPKPGADSAPYCHLRDRIADFKNPIDQWSLQDAVAASRVHELVTYFTDRLTTLIFSMKPFAGLDDTSNRPEKPSPLSVTETHRFQRALYRFQFFSELLFRERHYHSWLRQFALLRIPVERQDIWQDMIPSFATYEIEQLSCVNCFLSYLVAQRINNLLKKDALWPSNIVLYIDSEGDEFCQRVLNQGLPFVHSFLTAGTTDEQCTLLYSMDRQEPILGNGLLTARLPQTVEAAYTGRMDRISDLTTEEVEKVIRAPFSADPDPGPRTIWKWAHLNHLPNTRGTYYRFWRWRSWGYVFWDQARLESMNVYSAAWDWAASATDLFETLDLPSQEEMDEARHTQAMVLRQGRSIWWTPPNENGTSEGQTERL